MAREVQEFDQWEISEDLRRKMVGVAREFRKEPTPTERLLWQALRGRKLAGRKFRRQQPIGPFIVDFYCAAEKLIAEVDGSIHETQIQADHDRQHLLETLGLRFVRVKAEIVEHNLPVALDMIQNAFLASDAPSPRV